MHKYACCFTGHRKLSITEDFKQKLRAVIIELITKKNVKYFYAGGALGFDTVAALEILKIKEDFDDIQLILVLPCKNQDKYWSKINKDIYSKIKKEADKIIYTSESYMRNCMFIRNRYLIDNSNYCIAYCNQNKGGTVYTINYAKQKGIEIINIASE